MADVLSLAGDEDLDLIYELEFAFSIKFDPDELTRAQTVGDLFQLVLARVPSVEKSQSGCLTATAFRKFKRAIETQRPDVVVRPDTPIASLVDKFNACRWARQLQRATGLHLPAPEYRLARPVLVVPFAIVVVCSIMGPWISAGLALLSALLLWWLADRTAQYPKGLSTVGDLARATAGLNARQLAGSDRPMRRQDVWIAMTEVICASLGRYVPITSATRFG